MVVLGCLVVPRGHALNLGILPVTIATLDEYSLILKRPLEDPIGSLEHFHGMKAVTTGTGAIVCFVKYAGDEICLMKPLGMAFEAECIG